MRGRRPTVTMSAMELPDGLVARAPVPDRCPSRLRDRRCRRDRRTSARPPSRSRTSRATGSGAASTSRPRASACGTATGWRPAGEVFKGRRADASVHPDYRGRGIGTWLADWLEECARASGVQARRTDRARRQRTRSGSSRPAATGWAGRRGCCRCPPTAPSSRSRCPRATRCASSPGPADGRVAFQLIEDAFNEWPDRDPSSFEDWAPRGTAAAGLRAVADPVRRSTRRAPRSGSATRSSPAAPATSTPSRSVTTSVAWGWPGRCSSTRSSAPASTAPRQRALDRLAHRRPRPLRARRHAGHPDLAALDDRPLSPSGPRYPG